MATASSISPELVLVSPDLADAARAALPDRPWELFVPQSPLRPPRLAPPVAPIETPVAAHPWLVRAVAALPIVLLAIFSVAVLIGTTPWVSDRPSFEPPPTHVGQTTTR